MADESLSSDLNKAREEIDGLQRRLELLERRLQSLPDTSLLDQRFIARAFAVVGHHFVGSLIISIILALVYIVLLSK
jgi:hypothetical protein